MPTLQEQFGHIDIYLFDQLLRGNVSPGMTIFDAGCGTGRNIHYFLREGYKVFAIDPDPNYASLLPAGHFRAEFVEAHTFPDAFADVVICNTVLHFANDDQHFHAMLHGAWRALKPGGLFFSRLASSTGSERLLKPLGGRRYLMGDGTERYLVDTDLLTQHTRHLGAQLIDPIKTTVVHNLRSMTTWILRKSV
jgi:SAM-dependent methyltransferase